MATLEQIEQGILAADRVGDAAAVRELAAALRDLKAQPQPEGPGIGRSLARGAISGSLGLLDLGSQVAGYAPRAIYEGLGGTVPDFLQPSNAAQVAQQYTGTTQPPVTAGERAAELLGSSLMPGGIATKMAAKAGKLVPALATEASSLGGSMIGRELGVQAGGSGSTSEMVGTVLGGFTPAGLGAAAKGLSAPQLPYRSRQGQDQALSAFERQEVPATVADVTDKAYPQRALGKVPGGYGVQKGVRQNQQDAMEAAVKRLTPDVDDVTAGQAIHKGIQGYIDNTFMPVSAKLSKKLDENIPKKTPVELPNTQALFAKIRDEKGPFQGSLGVPALTKMEKEVEEAIALATPPPVVAPPPSMWQNLQGVKPPTPQAQPIGDIVDFSTLRRMRTAIGHKLASVDLVSEIPRVDLKRLYGAMSKDILVAAKAAGQKAEKSLEKLNRYWESGIGRVDTFLEPIAKKVTPEEAYRAVLKATKDSPTRIKHISKTLNPEQRESVLSAMIQNLGVPIPSAASIDRTFSPETFLTNLNKIDDENFARLARGTKYHKSSDLKDLRLVASRLREVDAVLKNPSGTGEALLAGGTAATGLGAAGVLITGGGISSGVLIGVGSAVGGSYAASRLLANPKFVKWVVRGNKLGPEKYATHVTRLATVMRNESSEDKEAAAEFIRQHSQEQGQEEELQ